MGEAQEEKEAHRIAFEELDGALQPEALEPWKLEIEYWEHNPNDPLVTNPFEPKVTRKWCWSFIFLIQSLRCRSIAITQAAVRLKLAEMEACDLQQGVDLSLHPDISPSVFIASGIDIEGEQYVVY
jgi:hypothetical protein